MFKERYSYKSIGGAIGFGLGILTTFGCLFFRLLSLKVLTFSTFFHEVGSNGFIYSYMGTTVPLVFTAFGFYLGFLRDEVYEQKISLENANKALEIRQSTLENMNDTLKNQAVMDTLTGLYNRRHTLIELEKEVERARRQKFVKPMLHALMIDVDNFKSVNDKFGHNVGDEVLIAIAEVIRRSVRKIDIAGRYGGDEFLIILPEATFETAQVVAERIQKNIRETEIETDRGPVNITLSMGLAPFDWVQFYDVSNFIDKVDWSLLTAKKEGKDRISISKTA
jgi:diguanylate cyclase (GGDEF)-like protein